MFRRLLRVFFLFFFVFVTLTCERSDSCFAQVALRCQYASIWCDLPGNADKTWSPAGFWFELCPSLLFNISSTDFRVRCARVTKFEASTHNEHLNIHRRRTGLRDSRAILSVKDVPVETFKCTRAGSNGRRKQGKRSLLRVLGHVGSFWHSKCPLSKLPAPQKSWLLNKLQRNASRRICYCGNALAQLYSKHA